MDDTSKNFRDRVDKSLGKYSPNKTSLNQISLYLLKEACKAVYEQNKDIDGGVESFVKSLAELGSPEMEIMSFQHAIKDLAVFSAQNIMMASLKKATEDVRNIIPLVERNEAVKNSNFKSQYNVNQKRYKDSSSSILNQEELDVEIDTSEIPKTSEILGDVKGLLKRNEMLSKSQEYDRSDVSYKKDKHFEESHESNVFDGDIEIDMDDVNQTTIRHNVSNKDYQTGQLGKEEMSTDGSAFTEEAYKSVPSVGFDLDY